VYRSDVRDVTDAKAGDIVGVVDDTVNFVGQALYSELSEIALRFLTTREETIDGEWWRKRLRNCAARRQAIARETNAYRLVYSEGDLMPSLIVDVYDQVFVMQTLSQGTERMKSTLVDLLVEEFKPRAIVERNDARVREFEGLELRTGVLWSAPAERGDDGALGAADMREPSESKAPSPLRSAGALQIEINQHGIRFCVSPLSAQKTGAFLDQRENYLAARHVAHGRALDCFTFNGGFALHIASACDSVMGIDISAGAITAAQRNAELNDARNVEFRTANVFDALREMESAGEKFDTIVLDPPAFAKNRSSVTAAARGYKEINLRALKLLNPGGILVTCTCSYHISEETFLDIIAEAALDARRRVQIIEKRGQSSDHPVLLGMPETHYLKCVVARAVS
jgi:23S rRNA (cytosine1962-C5)-methyltransferase